MAIELRDVRYFQTVVAHGNIGRAAEALGLSQPALSKSVRRLEEAVQSPVFTRTPKGVELTPAGIALFARAHRLRLAVEDVQREIDELAQGNSGLLRIGCGPDTGQDIVAEGLASLLNATPNLRCGVSVQMYDKLLEGVRNGTFDVIVSGIPGAPPGGMSQIPLFAHVFGIYASTSHRLANRSAVKLDDLRDEQWALAAVDLLPRRALNDIFERNGLPPPRVAIEAAPTNFRLNVVASTTLLGFFWRGVVEHAPRTLRLKQLRVRDVRWKRSVGITYRSDGYLSPGAQRLVTILKTLGASRMA